MLCVLRCGVHYVSGISLDREGLTISVADEVECAMIGERPGMEALVSVLASFFEELDFDMEVI